jgi:putative ABC transport system permease protein
MLLNYLKLSFRLLTRSPFFTCINVVGLAVGFTSFYALWQYSTSELKSDQYHRGAERIGRIGIQWQWLEESTNSWRRLTLGFSKTALLPALKEDFPEVESTLRILNQPQFTTELVNHKEKITVSIDNPIGQTRMFKEGNVAYADSNLFKFFSIPLVYGEPEHVLAGAKFVALSKSTASKYFGSENPTGELIRLNDTITLKVSGVYEDLPNNTHLNFDMVISNLGLLTKWNADGAGWNQAIGYVKLRHSDLKNFEARLNQRADLYWAALRSRPNRKLDMFVQPLADISFERVIGNMQKVKSRPFLITLGFIAISILTMAWVNYANLSVARTTQRFKEIATRKVSGAGTFHIVGQFVTESLVTNGFALALSFTFIQIVRVPVAAFFNIYFASPASLSLNSAWIFLSTISVGIMITGLYPAFITIARKPSELFLKDSPVSESRIIPSALTVAQLASALIFLMLGFTVFLQLNHILTIDTGIKKEQVILIDAPIVKPENYSIQLATLKKELLTLPGVSSFSSSTFMVTQINGMGFNAKRIGDDKSFGMDVNGVDEEFVSHYGLKILAGRNFVNDDAPDRIMITRLAASRLGFRSPDDAIGSSISVSIGSQEGWRDVDIIGVVENFRNMPFFESRVASEANTGRGMVLMYKDQLFKGAFTPDVLSARIMPQNFEETIGVIRKLCIKSFPSMVFSWSFLEEKINEVYAEEKIARNQIILFSALAVFIACLGLLGMISNKVVMKTKEIGIRKVLGAQLYDIVRMLLHATLTQIALASMIGVPVAYYLTQQYLEKYSERIALEWWHFALPVLILMVIMFSTIASVLWRAAKGNPVEALRAE